MDGRQSVSRWLQQHPDYHPDHVFAIGKAAASMMQGVIESGRQFTGGLVITKESDLPYTVERDARIDVVLSSHPVPDASSLEAGQALLSAIASTEPEAELLFLISGGTSSLVEVVRDGADLDTLQQVNRHLLASGKSIHQMNAWRKRFSRIKGGGLLSMLGARPSTQLMISDVKGDDPAVIGSGLLSRNDAESEPDPLLDSLASSITEQPVAVDTTVDTHIIATLDHARRAAATHAESFGLPCMLHAEFIEGDALEQGRAIAAELCEAEPGVHVFGGETTVNLPPDPGMGGRNQAMALAMSEVIVGHELAILCAGTDGIDGNSRCAGAMVTGDTASNASRQGFDIPAELDAANSGAVLKACGDLFAPGATNTNVMDLVIAYKPA